MNLNSLAKKVIVAASAISAMSGFVYAAESTTPSPGQQAAMSPAAQENAMKSMQENMQKMHDLMHRISKAKTSAERDRLNLEQRQLLQSNMQSMMEMMGGMGGMGGMAKPGGTGDMGKSGGAGGNMGGMHNMPAPPMPQGTGSSMPMQR